MCASRAVVRFVMWSAVLMVPAGAAAGQDPAGFRALPATLVGRVTDSAGAVIAEAEVILVRSSDSAVVKSAKSDRKGKVKLTDLPAGGPYTVTARTIGYGPAQGQVELRAGDTLYIDFELPPLVTTLAPITVTARRSRSRISEGEFNLKHYRDALSLLVDRRRDMLGDPERCPLPDPVFGGPGPDSTGRFAVTDRLTVLGGAVPSRKRPWLDSLRFAFGTPDLPYVQQLYVNGVRMDWKKVNGQSIPGRTVVEELRRIPLDQIAEIRYVDCWDQSVPLYQRYALYVVLKPPSRAVQDSIWRSITRDPARP